MTKYTFDMLLQAAFTIDAASEDAARAVLVRYLDAATCIVSEPGREFDDSTAICGEVSLTDMPENGGMSLGLVDGIEPSRVSEHLAEIRARQGIQAQPGEPARHTETVVVTVAPNAG